MREFVVPCPKCGCSRKYQDSAACRKARDKRSVCFKCAGLRRPPGRPLSDAQKTLIIALHGQGKTNRKIAEQAETDHSTVMRLLKKNGLECNGRRPKKLEEVGGGLAKCSKCTSVKPILEFTLNKGQSHSYRFSYCFECRAQQLKDNLNSDITRYLNERWRRSKGRARETGIVFTLTKQHMYDLYANQGGRCFYTDAILRCRVGEGSSGESFSIDRIVCSLGYEIGNIVLCSNRANRIKTDMTLDEMKEWMPGWYERIRLFLEGQGARAVGVECLST